MSKSEMQFKVEWCSLCEVYFVRCPKCGNNCCNGGYGKIGGLVAPDTWASDGKDCDICPLAYQYQDALSAESVDPYVKK